MLAPLEPRSARQHAAAVAVAGAVLVLVGWALTIRFNREGRWSALYCHGSIQSLPPEVASEDVYRFPGTGFDGQYYHLIAHDPFLRRGFDRFVPLHALFAALADPRHYTGKHPAMVLANQVTDAVALVGILLAFALAIAGLARRPLDEARAAAGLFALLGVLLQRRDHWDHVFDFGRVYSPLLLLLTYEGLLGRLRLTFALTPTLLMLPRVGTQLASQGFGLLKGLLRGAA